MADEPKKPEETPFEMPDPFKGVERPTPEEAMRLLKGSIGPRLLGAGLGALATKAFGGSFLDAARVFLGAIGAEPETPGAAELMGLRWEGDKDAEGVCVCRHGVFECPECAAERAQTKE